MAVGSLKEMDGERRMKNQRKIVHG